jgi:hypothetical protein
MLVETVVRIWNLAHLRFSVLKADLLKRAHFLFGLLLQSKNSGSGRMGRYQLENQSTNCLRLMLPGSTPKVYVRSKPLTPSTPVSQFSLARDPAIDTRVCIAKILFSSGINSLHTFLSDSIFVGLWLGLLNRCLQSHRSLLLKNLALRQQLAVLKRWERLTKPSGYSPVVSGVLGSSLSYSSILRRSFAGIALVFDCTGVGSRRREPRSVGKNCQRRFGS